MIDLKKLKRNCPLPALMRHLGLKQFIQSSCSSPFRVDNNASWGLYLNRDGEHRWKDFGTDEGGDQIAFLAHYLHVDEEENFLALLHILEAIADACGQEGDEEVPAEIKQPRELPDQSGFGAGTSDQLERLSTLRGISIEGLNWAQQRGVLIFGAWNGHEVFGVNDQSGEFVEVRRLDGEQFPPVGTLGERKSHALKGSSKKWPVGILEAAEFPCIALVEGLPDLLAAHDFVLREQALGGDRSKIRCAPVGVLTSSVGITDEALPYFAGKIVRIFQHADASGIEAARRWRIQLKEAGARSVDVFDTTAIAKLTGGSSITDLNDLLRAPDLIKGHPNLQRIMPR